MMISKKHNKYFAGAMMGPLLFLLLSSTIYHSSNNGDDDAMMDQPTTVKQVIVTKQKKAILATYLFGESFSHRRAVRMFVRSAVELRDRFDFVIIGDTEPPFDLPDNFQWINHTWHSFADHVHVALFHSSPKVDMTLLKKRQMRKINDFKPLLAFLFPHIFHQGYEFWGSCDNDMLLGNLTKYLSDDILDQYDIISGSTGPSAWGPFTLYRNIPTINTLFKKAPSGMAQIFVYRRHQAFDEYANYAKGNDKNNSMAGIIDNYAHLLGLRVKHGIGPKLQDKREPCWQRDRKAMMKQDPTCAECDFVHGTLIRTSDQQEVWLCHFQMSKKMKQHEASLADDVKFHHFLKTGDFRCNPHEGWTYLPPNVPSHNVTYF